MMDRHINESFTYPKFGDRTPIVKYAARKIFQNLQNSSFRGAAIFNELGLSLQNYKKNLSEKIYFHKLDQNVISYNLVVTLPEQWSSLHPTFKWKIKQLIQGGFFDHWLKQYTTHRSVVEKKLEEDKVVLTMDHLSVGFTIWLAMLLISLLGFIGEQIKFRITNYFRVVLHRN